MAVSVGTNLVNGRCAKTGASKARERTRGTKGRQRCTASFPRTPLRSVVGVPARRECTDRGGGGQTRTDGSGRQVLDGRGVHSMATLGVRTATLMRNRAQERTKTVSFSARSEEERGVACCVVEPASSGPRFRAACPATAKVPTACPQGQEQPTAGQVGADPGVRGPGHPSGGGGSETHDVARVGVQEEDSRPVRWLDVSTRIRNDEGADLDAVGRDQLDVVEGGEAKLVRARDVGAGSCWHVAWVDEAALGEV